MNRFFCSATVVMCLLGHQSDLFAGECHDMLRNLSLSSKNVALAKSELQKIPLPISNQFARAEDSPTWSAFLQLLENSEDQASRQGSTLESNRRFGAPRPYDVGVGYAVMNMLFWTLSTMSLKPVN